MYKAVIFDLDGTLVRTNLEYVRRLVASTLQELGIANHDPAHATKFWFGTNRDRTIRERFGVDPGEFWPVHRKHDHADNRIPHLEAYPDVDYLQTLKSEGYRIGLFTGAPERLLKQEITLVGDGIFDAVVRCSMSHEKGIKYKPDPEGLFKCMELLDVGAGEAVLVGNSEEDIIAAQAAGVLDILIDRGEYVISDAVPSLVIKTLYDLGKILKSQP